MACLGAVLYDPAAAVSKSTAAATAMAAFDTTNARLTFTCPANGTVLVKLRVGAKGATSAPNVFLGVLDGATVRGRQAAIAGRGTNTANFIAGRESVFLVTGLTPGNSYTFDAAWGCEFGVASSVLFYGGPNNTTANDAGGALSFEIWETGNLLAGKHYDPAAIAGSSVAALQVMTALDTTNLRLNFTVPASGEVLVRQRLITTGSTSPASILMGILEGSTIRMRQVPTGSITNSGTLLATDFHIWEAQAVIPGLTPAANLNWDAAVAVETAIATALVRYGGPNDTTASNAAGGFVFEIWAA